MDKFDLFLPFLHQQNAEKDKIVNGNCVKIDRFFTNIPFVSIQVVFGQLSMEIIDSMKKMGKKQLGFFEKEEFRKKKKKKEVGLK